MKNFFRWLRFTIAAALVGLVLAFGLLFLGRLYLGLQETAFTFSALMLYSIGLTIAAINHAAKLEAEEDEIAARENALRRPSREPAEREI